VLTLDQMQKLHDAVMRAGIERKILLVGLPMEITSCLRTADTPRDQILLDLEDIARHGPLIDGTVPLRVWLNNAVHARRLVLRS
jgi:hypothetical protein